MNEDEIRALLDDRMTLALTLWAEARSEPVEGAIAVACVIRTRAAKSGQSVKDVCLARKQFSCWNPGQDANHVALMTLAERIVDSDHVERPTFDAAFLQCRWIADGILAGVVRDNVGRADHYLTRALFESPQAPSWSKAMPIVARVGAHVFLRS